MASTTYTGVQYRTITAAHMAAEFPSVSGLIASGAVRVDPNPPFKGGGGISYNVPHFLEITGADVVATAATDGTRNAISTYKDVGPIVHREYGVGVEDIAQYVIGSDSNIGGEIERQAPQYWAKRLAVALYSVAKGGFTTDGVFAISQLMVDSGSTFNRAAVENIIKMDGVGDQWPDYRIWIMHSKQFAQALTDGIVNYMEAGAFAERLLNTGNVPTIFGKQVVVDDNIVETDGTTYLCKANAFYLGFQADVRVEYQRDSSLGGGTDEYWLRTGFMPHVFGLTYAGSALPTNTTLATAASWTLSQSTDYKLHRIIKVKFVNT